MTINRQLPGPAIEVQLLLLASNLSDNIYIFLEACLQSLCTKQYYCVHLLLCHTMCLETMFMFV